MRSYQMISKLKIKLFWKILFWFWLSTSAIILINLLISQINSDKIHYRPLPVALEKELDLVAEKLERSFNSSRRFSQRNLKMKFDDIYLIDQLQKEYFDQTIPDVLADLNSRVIRSDRYLSAFQKRQIYLGGKLVKIKDVNYRLYILKKDSLLNRHFIGGFFRDLAKSLIFSIFIISFPVSFLLSWIITRPLKQLQRATHDIKQNIANQHNLDRLVTRSDEFGDLARDFVDMSRHISDTLKSQKQLLSDVSHELRSPLSRLKIALGMAEQKQIPQLDTDINRIKLETNRMNEMLDNLLTLSKLETQENSVTKEQLDLCSIIKAVIDDGRFEAEQQNIKIQLNLPEAFSFIGSQESLMSGIENVLRNAIKYTGENGTIACSLSVVDNKLEFSISDTGPGVPTEQLDKLFDAFYRPDFDRARNKGGVGLGLSIAKRAFAINGGAVFAENVQPHGLRIGVRFSLVQT